MQLWNRQRDQEKLTKKGKFSPQASPTSGHSPRKDVGYLLALAGGYKPPTRLPFWGLPSVIMRHHEVTEQGSSPASHRVCHSFMQAHGRVSRFSSVQFSCSVVSNSLQPHELQHTRPLCPSPTPGVHPNPCPSSWWCHPTISPSVVPFSSCPQSFPASGSFQMSQLFSSGGQSIGVSASTSVPPMNTQDWSP